MDNFSSLAYFMENISSKATAIWVAFSDFFKTLILGDVTIGEYIASVLPDFPLSFLFEWILPFNLYEFLFVSVGVWLGFVLVKFVVSFV